MKNEYKFDVRNVHVKKCSKPNTHIMKRPNFSKKKQTAHLISSCNIFNILLIV